jgi:hypothetical protein
MNKKKLTFMQLQKEIERLMEEHRYDWTYDWVGDWEAPGYGSYVIREDAREMEPGEVIELLNQFQDIMLQKRRTANQ